MKVTDAVHGVATDNPNARSTRRMPVLAWTAAGQVER